MFTSGPSWDETKKGFVETTPQPADIFIMDFGGGKGHTGFVENMRNPSRINTIEGNSNTDGSRNGEMVCRNPLGRKTITLKGFIRVF